MKKKSGKITGKMLNHGRDLGAPEAEDVEQRAEEIASIESHAPSADDREQAQRELSGDLLPPTTEDDAVGVGALTRDPSEPLSIPGRQIPDQETEDGDGQSMVERLVADGVDEADSEQMLADRQRRKPPTV